MGDSIRRIFLSVAVALGLAGGQPDPAILAGAGIDAGALVVRARMKNAFAPSAVELVETGTAVAIRFHARLAASSGATYEANETRVLRYDQRGGRYVVAFGRGKTASLVDPAAARDLASQLADLELCPAPESPAALPGDSRVAVDARIGIVDSRGEWHDAPVLWNYVEPRASFTLAESAAGGR